MNALECSSYGTLTLPGIAGVLASFEARRRRELPGVGCKQV